MAATTEKLLPDSLVSALQTLVSVATISLITFGDRTLNAALAALATVLFSLTMEKLQKYKSWKHLWNSLGVIHFNSFFRQWKLGGVWFKTKRMSENKREGPTDFDPRCVPAVPIDTVFKYCLDLGISERLSRDTLNSWICDTFGTKTIFDRPELQTVQFSSKKFFQIGDVELPNFQLGYNKFVPIWCSNGEYVYKTLMIEHPNYLTTNLLVSNSKTALNEVISAINEHAKKKPIKSNCQTLSILTINASSPSLYKSIGLLSKTRTFENLFFEQKDELLEVLTRFRDGTMYAEHLGEDNKLGILLYGPPGTGKTACMAAVANFLGRSPVVVTGTQLLKRKIMDIVLYDCSSLIIMDEFDCLMDVIKKRSGIMGASAASSSASSEDADYTQQPKANNSMKYLEASNYFKLASEEKDPTKKKELMQKYEDVMNSDEDVVDMAYILSKFQGIQSADGRCIIACTNDPSRIDDALKRKGRFDIILHLDNASPSIILDMVAHYFLLSPEEKMALSEEFLASLPMKVIAPATVQDINASSKDAREALSRMASYQVLRPCLMAPNSPRQSVSSSGSTGEPV